MECLKILKKINENLEFVLAIKKSLFTKLLYFYKKYILNLLSKKNAYDAKEEKKYCGKYDDKKRFS